MPVFAHPGLLLFLPVVPLLLWCWSRQRRAALRFPDLRLLASLPPGRRPWARRGGAAVRAFALTCLVIALAGPRWPDLRTRVETEGIAILMVLDTSGSMAEPDFAWDAERISRLDAAKRAFGLFVVGGVGPGGERLPGRPNDLIGLVTFATRPEAVCPLTLSHSVLLALLDDQRPHTVPTESQTNLGDAIAWGLRRLETAGLQRKVLVLLTDGEHNVPPPALKPRQAAQLAANLGVPIYAIDAGAETPSGASVEGGEKESAANRQKAEQALRGVAQLTGGRYFSAHDAATLLAVCGDIDRLERGPIESFQYRRYREAAPWLGLAALVALAVVAGLEGTAWRRVP
jgi:Ca-activated chloride channel family protein